MPKTITLRGSAAKAFIHSSAGEKSTTEEEKYLRIATHIYMQMALKTKEGEAKASLIVRALTREGFDKTLDLLEGR